MAFQDTSKFNAGFAEPDHGSALLRRAIIRQQESAMPNILERLAKRIKECEVRYGRPPNEKVAHTDDASLLIAARDTIVADGSELGRLRQDNLRLIDSLSRSISRENSELTNYKLGFATQTEKCERLEGIISQIGEVNERMAVLAEKEKEWAQNAVAALKTAEKELTHAVPGSCYSTGPMTGDPIQDLVACPGCAALAKVRAAISSHYRANQGD